MEITRDVILDLLPLYVADEASADTKALVGRYLEKDPELADIARESAAMDLPADAPFPLTQEDMMEAYKEAKRLMFLRTVVLAGIISFSALAILALGVIAAAFFIG
jgi:anti-sigma factor RsiW